MLTDFVVACVMKRYVKESAKGAPYMARLWRFEKKQPQNPLASENLK
jgi:hypothetical protein